MDEETSLVERSGYEMKPCIPMQTICYGLGHVYNDLCAAIWFSYTLFYFQIVLQMDPTIAGTLIMIGQVADSVATPAAGWAVDWIGTPRAWHLTGSVMVAAGFSFIFAYNPGAANWWSLLYYGGLVVLFQVGWAVVQISHLSVITSISRNNAHSTDLTVIRYTASVCCNIFVYLITWAILLNTRKQEMIGPNDYFKFKEIVLIITGIGILCSIIFYCGINENQQPKYEEIETAESCKENGKSEGKSFLKSLVTYQVSLMYMSSRLYTTLNLIYIPLYLDERITNLNIVDSIRGAVASVPLVCFLASFCMSLILKHRPQVFNDKVVYALGSIISMIGCTWIAIGVPDGITVQIYAVASIIGIASSATMVTSLCMTAQFVNTNGFKGGSVYSTVTFTDKLISGAAVLIIQHMDCGLHDLCPTFYEKVLAYGTGCSSIIGITALITLQFTNPKMLYKKNNITV